MFDHADPSNRDIAAEVDSLPAMSLDQIHLGLPDDAPWFVRVVLRSRSFLVVTIVITTILTIIAASNPDWLLRIDQPISEWIRGAGIDLSFAKLVTQLGSPNLAIGVGLIAVVVLWGRCRASALTLGTLMAAALTADIVLKLVVDRPRPPNPDINTQLSSFPSGHVIQAVVMFGLVPLLLWVLTNRTLYLRLGFVVFAVVVLSVAVSRVRLGAHWPSDVVASFFIGATLLLAAESLLTSDWATKRCSSLGYHASDSSL
ncbi:MAG: phosphatase PAP2 family protein [Actinomycetota bacterium]|nr:phosphatase PAP2 family protein [Actinomycetota bacterium]